MPRQRKVTPEVLEEMGRLRGDGMSYGEIACRPGLATMTVYNHLQKRGKPSLIGRLRRRLGLR